MKFKESDDEVREVKEVSRPHPDWQLNFSYYNRFDWPNPVLSYKNGIPTHAVFKAEQEQLYKWPGGQRAVSVIVTTILDFHEPEVVFKKKAIELAKAMQLSIQEPKKHVLFAQG